MIAEREREREVSRLRLRISEHVRKLHRELVIVVEESAHFSHYAAPLLLVGGHHAEGRLQPLVVQFCL